MKRVTESTSNQMEEMNINIAARKIPGELQIFLSPQWIHYLNLQMIQKKLIHVAALAGLLLSLTHSAFGNMCQKAEYLYTHDHIGRLLCPVEYPAFVAYNVSSPSVCLGICADHLGSKCTSYSYNMSSGECHAYNRFVYNYEYTSNCFSFRLAANETYNPPREAGSCIVELQSWGWDINYATPASMLGGIYINGVQVFNYNSYPGDPTWWRNRGTTVVIFNMETCSIGADERFDPFGGGTYEAYRLGSYLQGLPDKLILLFITTDEPWRNLWPAYGPLYNMFRVNINNNNFGSQGKFVIITQKGSSPQKTFYVVHRQYGPTAYMNLSIHGNTLDDVQIDLISYH